MEYDHFVSVYADDVETTALPNELLILRTMFKYLEPVHFGDLAEKLKTISESPLLTTAATKATPERPYSLARRVKTWLRSSTT